MKSSKIKSNENIILYNNKYYIVNDYTLNLFECIEKSNNIKELSKMLNIKTSEVREIFDDLNEKLKNVEYYDNNIELKMPLKIQWKITPYCNLKCKHCYIGDINDEILSKEKLLQIADKIISAGVMEVTLTGGEALTVEFLDEIVEKLNKNNINILIFTNGIFLKKFIDKIEGKVDKTIIRFSVSVDGTKNVHDSIRGEGTFDKTIEGIKYALYKEYDVLTNTVLSAINYLDFPKLYKELSGIGLKKIQISNLIDSGRANASMKLSDIQNKEFIKLLKEELSGIKSDVELLYASMPTDENEKSNIYVINKNNINFIGEETWKCSAGIGKATINFDGNLCCCPFLKNSFLGNLQDHTIEELWTTKERYDFLKFIINSNNNSRVCIVARNRIN